MGLHCFQFVKQIFDHLNDLDSCTLIEMLSMDFPCREERHSVKVVSERHKISRQQHDCRI